MSGARRLQLLGLATLAIWTGLASSASAANQTVNVGTINGADKSFSPSSVSVFTGNTVTWLWVGPSGDTDHIVVTNPRTQAEDWDSDPLLSNVTHVVGHTFPHTFTKVGTFTYWCKIHTEQMTGTVTVADGRPTATFTMAPGAVTTGQRVDFDAMASTDPDGIITAWDWDLDGGGTFDDASGATSNRTYATAGTFPVTLRVTDNLGNSRTITKQLVVSAAPPAPQPVVEPMPTALSLGTPIVDATPLVAKLSAIAAATQRKAATRGVSVQVTCDIGCVVTATGSVALKGGRKILLTKATKTLAAGQALKLVLAVPAKSRAVLLRHLKQRKSATATIVLTTAQGTSIKKTVKLTL